MSLATIFSKPDPYKFRKLLLRSQRELNMSTDTFVKHNTGYTRAELENLAAEETEREKLTPTRNAAKLRAEFEEFELRVLQAEAESRSLEERKATLFEKAGKLSQVEEELSGLIANHAGNVATAKANACEGEFGVVANPMDLVARATRQGAIEFLSCEVHILASRKAALAKCQADLAAVQSELEKIK